MKRSAAIGKPPASELVQPSPTPLAPDELEAFAASLLVPAQAALAMPVEGALQLRLTPAALDLAADQVEDLDPVLTEDEVSATDVECYDLLGIQDFNLSVPIDSVTLTPGNGTLRVQVELGVPHSTPDVALLMMLVGCLVAVLVAAAFFVLSAR